MTVTFAKGSILRRCQSPYHRHQWQTCLCAGWKDPLVAHTRVSPFLLPTFHQISTLEKTTFRQCSILSSLMSKRNDWSCQWFSQTTFVWSFPMGQEIFNFSQMGITFHRIRPPIFIQTWLQQCCRCPFLNSAHCSLSNPICFRSVWCRRTMIPGKIFTSFAKFQRIVSVNDFWFPRRLKELHYAILGLLTSFCFIWVGLYPLRCQILDHHGISMTASRFTIFTENFCDLLLSSHQNSTKYGFAIASSTRGSCNFGPLADLAISVFREVSINTVFTQIRTSRKRTLWRWFMRRTGVWVSVLRNFVIH